MRLKTLTAAGIAAVAAALTMSTTPATAGSTSITDANGFDFDASCKASATISPPPANSYGSAGCTVSTYDGSNLSADITLSTLGSVTADANVSACASTLVCLTASMTVRATALPAPGSTDRNALDLPDGTFQGVTYFTMFQNTATQTNVDNPSGGCARIGTGGRVRDQQGSWKDGYHKFYAYNINWNGTKWVHAAHIGEYDPSPDGAFFFTELGTNDGVDNDGDGNLWDDADVNMTFGTDWTASATGGQTRVTAVGVAKRADTTNCAGGVFRTVYGQTGNNIINVKALSTVNQVVTLPVTVPLSGLCPISGGLICESDITSVGGFVFFSDTTSGNSTAGLANSNITGIAYSGGAIGVTDTLGDGPTCPTPTVGGTLPQNPLFTPNTACQIDDDPVARGSFLSEWWDTAATFTV